ncbi:hypothetical protein HS125_12605 [bacterium]|nr:hypothetical protein [bacterium]
MKPPSAPLHRGVLLAALIAVVAITACTLLWMRFSLESQLGRTILESLAEEVQEVLYPQPAPFFGRRLEEIARRAQRQHPEIARLVITVFLPTGAEGRHQERVVFPDSILFGGGEWSRHRPSASLDWTREGQPLIRLYVNLSLARSYRLNLVMAALAGAILLLALLVAAGIRQQERRLARNSVELSTVRGELAKLERRALVGQISASLIHDLKKPVLHIREESTHAQQHHPSLAHIAENAELFLAMIRDLKLETFLSSDSAPAEYLYLDETADQSYRLVQYEAKQVEFQNRIPPDLPMVLAVPHRLIQVFSNLFLNSLEAMEGRGRILVEGRRASERRIVVTVEDNGPGIPQESLPHIFAPFYSSRKREGSTGLGLYICRSLMEEMGGTIDLDRQFAGGARFVLTFPEGAPPHRTQPRAAEHRS